MTQTNLINTAVSVADLFCGKVGEVGMKKMFRMVAAIYMPMEENETQEQAEDRAIELIEDAGMEVYSWWNAEEVEVHEVT